MSIRFARLALILPFAALAACDAAMTGGTTGAATAPMPAPRTPAQTVSAAPAETTAAEAAAAEAAAAAPAATAARGRLGTTVASLGDATEAGLWLKTPLVKARSKGRVVDPATGRSVNVDLIPLGGAASAGSQMSLPAMTALGVGLTDLPEVEVFAA